MDKSHIRDLLGQYLRHGWILRRALLSKGAMDRPMAEEIFGNVPVISSTFDAVWFSRPTNEGLETWELRHLSHNPYALLESFPDGVDESVRDERLFEIERQMKAVIERPVH